METKSWYESKGIWGGIISVLALVAGAFGVNELTPEVQAQLVDNAVVLASVLASLIGTILGIVGRLKAKSTIGEPPSA